MPLPLSLLELVDAQHLKRELLVKRLAGAGAHLAQEVFLETDLGHVHPLALRGPIDVAGRQLRLGHESNAAIAEISQTHRVP
jgi:hypothetical protein